MEWSLHSFQFFIKELNDLCVLIYIYLYISIYISIYIYIYIEKRTERSAFFCKRMKHSRVLLHSLQKNIAIFALFYVLCKRTLRSLRSFPLFRKEWKRTECSFGSHKSPKTKKKMEKNGMFIKRTECSERCPTLLLCRH